MGRGGVGQGGAGVRQGGAGECECVFVPWSDSLFDCQTCYRWFEEASEREAKTIRFLHVLVCTLSPNTMQ